MNEHEITDLLERGTERLTPDIARLVDGGVARGRRTLRRRRSGAALAASALIGVIGVGFGVLQNDPGLTGDTPGASDSTGVGNPSQAPLTESRKVDSDGDGVADVEVTADLHTPEAIHAEIQAMLGTGASDVLVGSRGPRTTAGGDELSWFFRFDGAEAQVSVHPVGRGCTPPGEQLPHQSGCLETNGVGYRTAGPWSSSGGGQRGQTAVAYQQGFEIMVISENVRYTFSGDSRQIADSPTIPLPVLVDLATSGIWFEDPA